MAAILGGGVAAAALWSIFTRVPLIRIPLEPLEARDYPALESKPEIDPEFKINAKKGVVICFDPATGEKLGEVPDMTPEEVKKVLERAKRAQKSWAETSFATRKYFLRLLLKYTVEERDVICRTMMRDSGKVKLDAILGEIIPTAEKLRWMIKHGEACLQTESRYGQGVLTAHKKGRVEYRPLGVLAIFAPFNYPYTNAMNHVISGCFSGNAVVIKVSEFTSWSGSLILRIVRKALVEVGGDPDLVQIVTGLAPAGEALCRSPLVDKIIFTGSDKVGKIIQRQASDNLTPCVLELGGKDPFIVFGDVNLDRVTSIAARGVFQNGGQNCIGIERIFVEEKIEKQFINRMVAIVSKMKVGRPFDKTPSDLGAICTAPQLAHIESLVEDAVAKGAICHYGGKRIDELRPGLFFTPTVLSNVTRDMRITQEEVFGPVAVIRSFQTEDELIEMVNDCPFALGASVFSKNGTRAKRIAGCVETGMCNLNDFGVNYLVQSLPFGGAKASGYGRFGGEEGLKACCQMVALTEDAFPGVETNLPGPFRYPTAGNAYTTAGGLIEFAYAESVWDQLGGLATLLKGLMFPQKR